MGSLEHVPRWYWWLLTVVVVGWAATAMAFVAYVVGG